MPWVFICSWILSTLSAAMRDCPSARGPRSLRKLLQVLILLLLLLRISSAIAPSDGQTLYRVSCGAMANQTDTRGRIWVGDSSSAYLDLGQSGDNQLFAKNPNLLESVPFSSARIFNAPATYSFPIAAPALLFLRLFFQPIPSYSFQPEDANFFVSADTFTLVRNLRLASNVQYLVKEYCLNVSSTVLKVTFTPAGDIGSYAMVNGIEVVAMPDLVAFQSAVPVAMETVHRLNVGGQKVADVEGRIWLPDRPYMRGAAVGISYSATANTTIIYSQIPTSTAPPQVYQSARLMTDVNAINLQSNLSWDLTVDANFTYYVRLHFCELLFSINNRIRIFDIFINQRIAYQDYEAPGAFVAAIQDFQVDTLSSGLISVQLHPSTTNNKSFFFNAILNGIEIFKLNDSTGNLQGTAPPSPVPQQQEESSSASSSSSSHDAPPSRSNKKIISIIGGTLGAIAAVAALPVLALCLKKKRREDTPHR